MNNLIEALKDLIIKAGEIAVRAQKLDLIIERKQDNSPVSNADKQVSEFIYSKLRVLTPEIPIICEEQPIFEVTGNKFWLIDPIDGTKSYIKGKSTYTVNIGLVENFSSSIGLIYLPAYNKLYYTDATGKLKIEGDAVGVNLAQHTSNNEEPITYNAVISSHHTNLATRHFLAKYPINEIQTVASSIKLCRIAEGTADIFPKFGKTMEWDTAAGHALIKASGGNIFYHNGKELQYNKPNFRNPDFYGCSYKWIKSIHNDLTGAH